MKIKSLLLCIAISGTCYSQTINNFNSALGSIYIEVTATLDQSAIGINAIWNYTNLVTNGNTNVDTYAPPTGTELATYPGTTEVLSVTTLPASTVNQIFTKDDINTNEVSITGATGDAFNLNYDANNALIGTFPLSFGGFPNNDPVAGTVFASGVPGTFTGTINTDVDGYGMLTMNDVGGGVFSGNVTRLKTVQNLNISIIIFNGTATQTSYNYYADNGDLVFRTSDVTINIPGIINQTTSLKESLFTSVLSVNDQSTIFNSFKITPNPVGEYLNIKMNNFETINSILIMDVSGRTILKVDGDSTSIPVNFLNTGIYFASITTDRGAVTQKFIKK